MAVGGGSISCGPQQLPYQRCPACHWALGTAAPGAAVTIVPQQARLALIELLILLLHAIDCNSSSTSCTCLADLPACLPACRVVESIMKSGKMVLTDAAHKVAGHYPGWKVGARCVWVGLHGGTCSACCCWVSALAGAAWL